MRTLIPEYSDGIFTHYYSDENGNISLITGTEIEGVWVDIALTQEEYLNTREKVKKEGLFQRKKIVEFLNLMEHRPRHKLISDSSLPADRSVIPEVLETLDEYTSKRIREEELKNKNQ